MRAERTTNPCPHCKAVTELLLAGKYNRVRVGLGRIPLEGRIGLADQYDFSNGPVTHQLLIGDGYHLTMCQLEKWRRISLVEQKIQDAIGCILNIANRSR